MGFLDKLFGRTTPPQPNYGGYQPVGGQQQRPQAQQGAQMSEDERAIARYEYMLKTARPEDIEKAHEEAFAKLTPQQRQQVLQRLTEVSPQEAPQADDPRTLARAATRAEMRQPGILRSSFGGYGYGGGFGGGMGMGSMLLTSVAGAFVGTAIADAMFDGWGDNDFDSHDMQDAYRDGYQDGAQNDGANDASGADQGDGSGFADDYAGGDDFGGFDAGGMDGGDFGGDMGGFDV